jgi:mycothione reductase
MRLPTQPRSMIIVGAGYVAAEFAHVFSAYGTEVTVVARSAALLRHEDAEISSRFTRALGERVELRLRHVLRSARRAEGGGVSLDVEGPEGPSTLTAEVLLLATGRIPNGDRLDLARTGVTVDDDGYVIVDEHQQTVRSGIFALGDVSSHHQLKHVANHEARVVQHNLLHPTAMIAADHRFVPHAVFSSPQVASVGLTEEQAFRRGVSYVVGQTEYASTAYGWAMGETGEHLVKVLADPATGLLLGAHLIGPETSSLIQPLIQAMSFGLRSDEVARGQYWIHPAMAEVVENALLALRLDRLAG